MLWCVPTGLGYIAYAMMYNGPEFLRKRTAVVLSDPVCDKEHYSAIAEAFIKEHPKAMFAQVNLQSASGLEPDGSHTESLHVVVVVVHNRQHQCP